MRQRRISYVKRTAKMVRFPRREILRTRPRASDRSCCRFGRGINLWLKHLRAARFFLDPECPRRASARHQRVQRHLRPLASRRLRPSGFRFPRLLPFGTAGRQRCGVSRRRQHRTHLPASSANRSTGVARLGTAPAHNAGVAPWYDTDLPSYACGTVATTDEYHWQSLRIGCLSTRFRSPRL